jgi:NADPH-dependent 2,4-dienoyl-CoA reductase/sulfur reductase-like enzyme
MTSIDVAVVGAGPAGLTAAAHLRRLGAGRVVVFDRDTAPGGVPRYTEHTGYGIRDLHRVMSGPAYARRLANDAARLGAELRMNATVTSIAGGALEVTSPDGRERLEPRAILLATGCRERPRTARLVPGSRPYGVFTTGWLQRLVHLEHGSPGRKAVIIGAEHVSYSAVATLAEAGCRTVAMATHEPGPNTFDAFAAGVRLRWRVPLLTNARVESIEGARSVEAVHVVDGRGRRTRIPCDCVIFTGDWVGENELARRAGLAMADGLPAVDGCLRTSQPGTFAAGNLLHPATQADLCALDGKHAAGRVAEWLDAGAWPTSAVPITVQPPLMWVSPSRVAPLSTPPEGRLMIATSARRRHPRIVASQAGTVLGAHRLPWLEPTRPMRIPAPWSSKVDPAGPAVELRLD